jgi:Fe-S-cluster containining protein
MPEDPSRPPEELLQGLLYTHTRANLNTIEAHRALSKVEALVELLVERGVLDGAEVDERRQAAEERLRLDFVEKGMAVAIQEHPTSKYEVENAVEIDCEARVHLCKAACCRLTFALSKEDVEESVVRWDLGRPYMIAQTSDRRCVHLDGATHACGVYGQRPVPCRTYDCRRDRRVWLDFEERIVNPRLDDPDWPRGAVEDEDRS